jgi:DNA-binding Lrp family transcriptional regulator
MDELDYRIVDLLHEDARMSSRHMTCRLGDVSDRVVRYRIKGLLDRRILLLQAMVDPRQIGYPVIADVLIDVLPGKLAETCAKLMGMETVASMNAAVAGRQVSIQVNARDKRDLMTLVNSTLPQIEGVVSVQTMVVPILVKDLAYWKPPMVVKLEWRPAGRHSSPVRRTPGSVARWSDGLALMHCPAVDLGRRRSRAHDQDPRQGSTTPLDALDRQIIELLREDPRTSSPEMTRRLGDVSDRVVRYRIRRLLERRIVLVQARVNPHAVGYPVIADILIEVLPWRLADARAAVAAMGPVCYVGSAVPGRDGRELSIEVNARSNGELEAFVKKRLPRVDGIVSAHTVVVPRLAKDVADWAIPR